MKTILLSLLLAAAPLFTTAHACGAYGDEDTFVAHEWGTFTSVQGADGILIPWNPYLISELPSFVYDRTRPKGDDALRAKLGLISEFGKYNLSALQRMETPVIYFYSTRERMVDVSVKFPLGLVTEWYPQAKNFGPVKMNAVSTTPRPDSFIDWVKVKILPATQNAALAGSLPSDKSGSHYFAARATDANLIQTSEGPVPGSKPEHEKFLFYRGLGQFPSPLKVSLAANESVVLDNLSGHPIPHLFVYNLRNGRGSFQSLEKLGAGKMTVPTLAVEQRFTPQSELIDQMCRAMEQVLIDEGLFPKEAAAMVATWRDSWFAEDGVRVFYLVPRPVTDGILPLAITPKPSRTARVFVGRAEMITPTVEQRLLEQITRFGSSDPLQREAALAAGRDLKLGRFGYATVSRVVGRLNAPTEFSNLAWRFYNAMQAAPATAKTAAVR